MLHKMSLLQFEKGKGTVLSGRRYSVVFVPGSYDFGDSSEYYSTTNTDPIFWLSSGIIGGSTRPFLTSDPDLMLSSRHERIIGSMQFVRKGDTLVSVDQNINLVLTLKHAYLKELYVGTPLNVTSNQQLFFYKRNTADTSNYGRLENIIGYDSFKMIPGSFLAEIASGSLLSDSDYLDLTSFTKTGSLSKIPSQGILLVYNDSGSKEYIKYDYFDPIDEIFTLGKRGMSYTSPITWSGNFKVKVFDPTNLNNFDAVTSDMYAGMKAYILPEPGETYYRPHLTMKYLYSASVYFRATTIYSSNTGNKYQEFSHLHVAWFLYANNDYPAPLTTNKSSYNSKIISKTNNTVTDIWFTNPVHADQGVIFDYCTENEYCGPCMGNTKDIDNICYLRADAYSRVQNEEEPNEEAPSYADNKDWNKRNQLENFTLPIVIASFIGVISLAIFIVYGTIYADFRREMTADPQIDDRMGNWVQSSSYIKDARIAAGILCTFFFIIPFVMILVGLFNEPGNPDKRFFPIVNFKRSVYNPPPGYTFVNAPTNDDAPV